MLTVAVMLAILTIVYVEFVSKPNKTIEQLLQQQAKYERLLDSTANYIFQKYDEFLPDTYWEGDVYWNVYEGSEDKQCWTNKQ